MDDLSRDKNEPWPSFCWLLSSSSFSRINTLNRPSTFLQKTENPKKTLKLFALRPAPLLLSCFELAPLSTPSCAVGSPVRKNMLKSCFVCLSLRERPSPSATVFASSLLSPVVVVATVLKCQGCAFAVRMPPPPQLWVTGEV